MSEAKNKTLAIELEDLKKKIVDALWDEELSLWSGSASSDEGWNAAIRRSVEVVGEVK